MILIEKVWKQYEKLNHILWYEALSPTMEEQDKKEIKNTKNLLKEIYNFLKEQYEE